LGWPVISLGRLGCWGIGDDAGVEAEDGDCEVFRGAGEAVEDQAFFLAGWGAAGVGLGLRLVVRGEAAGAGAFGELRGHLGQALEPFDAAGAACGGLRREA
jgi:hypothetical protein